MYVATKTRNKMIDIIYSVVIKPCKLKVELMIIDNAWTSLGGHFTLKDRHRLVWDGHFTLKDRHRLVWMVTLHLRTGP